MITPSRVCFKIAASHRVLLISVIAFLLAACATPPEAELLTSTTIGQAPLTVIFTNNSRNAEEFSWDFGDGSTATTATLSEPVAHEYTQTGVYFATLTATKPGDEPQRSTAAATVTVEPGPLDRVVLDTTQLTVAPGQGHTFEVGALDRFDNPIPVAAIVFRADGKAGAVDSSGRFVAETAAGLYADAVTVEVKQGEISRTASVEITINPGPLDTVKVDPPSITLEVAGEQRFAVMAVDKFDNAIPGLSPRFNSDGKAGQVGSGGDFTAGTNAGTYEDAVTVEVSQGLVTRRASADVTLEPGPLAGVSPSPAALALNIGQSQKLEAEAFDAYGNSIQDARVSWKAATKVGTIDAEGVFTTGTLAGIFDLGAKVTVTHKDKSVDATISVEVRPDPPTTVNISPVSVAAGTEQQLQATVMDQYKNRLEETRITWATNDLDIGNVTRSGLFNAGEVAGVFDDALTIEIEHEGQVHAAVSDITVIPSSLERVVIAPEAVDIGIGMTQQFVVVKTDRYGNRISDLQEVWSVEGGGSIDSRGLFKAGEEGGAGVSRIKVEVAQGDSVVSDTGNVTVVPDRISFVSDRSGGELDIYLMDVDGSNVKRLTSGSGIREPVVPSWSASGRYLAYESCPEDTCHIVILSDDGTRQVRLTSHDDFMPNWSPDGTQIAFTSSRDGNWEIYVMDADGSNQTRLTENPSVDAQPVWSPDGARLAFISNRNGNAEIYVMNANGSGKNRLTNDPADDTFPTWSPDGATIAFQSDKEGASGIYQMDADGTGVRQLIGGDHPDVNPGWSPDGTLVLFNSVRDSRLSDEIYAANVDGSDVTRLTDDPATDFSARWAPGRRGVEVGEASIIVPTATTLRPIAVERAVTDARSAVVRIETDQGSGSGFVVDSTGFILTPNHIIRNARRITVHLEDGSSLPGRVHGRDLIRDLALISIEETGLKALELGDLSRVPLASEVLVLGYPLGESDLTVTRGIVSAFKSDKAGNLTWVQTDAAINLGGSGGPLLDLRGRVVGMVTAKAVGVGIEGFGFATSANTIRLYLDRLRAGEVIGY